jgi:hypothetical protein
MKRLENERLKEKYNIFVSDITIYNKLINEKHFTESFIPPFFEAKYYIIKYLYKHNYFESENLNGPSQELFDLYNMLYNFVNNNFKINKDNEDFIDIIEDFEDLNLQDCFYEGEYQTQPITIETSNLGFKSNSNL